MPNQTFNVKVTPRSSKSAVIKNADGSLKVRIKSAPIDGRANAELVELLADYFKTVKSAIEITKGLTSKRKLVTIRFIKNSK